MTDSTGAPSAASPPDSAAAGRSGFIGKIIRFFEDDDYQPEASVEQQEKPPLQLKPSWYYWIFAASGFSGLIYESIWARYLKLFLGHAAYAQALVLVIFLFGLALGAALCARASHRLERPLLWYAGIEVLVALTAVYFHEIFLAAQSWAVDSVLPQIESDSSAEIFKWVLASALILPQSILLGATFPLMSAGLLRIWREQQGRIVAMLYFSNSLGAVFGVLASGFLLIPFAGLPGTIAIAGFINVAAATAVWALGHLFEDTGKPIDAPAASLQSSLGQTPAQLMVLILTVAFGTGMASFVYEIIWIRMLSLLMGSSTHNFEIMLAAFILGLALGGLAVRRRVDAGSGDDLLVFLGKVQIVMGVLALWSLFCFPLFYELLNRVLLVIPRDDAGWWGYTALRLGLALVMMLPATFCAGMTLPLLTRRLMDSGGESAVGRVYAVNTLGAIVGVLLTMHLLLPVVGMQEGLILAAMVDMMLGIVLLMLAARARVAVAAGVSVAALVVAAFFGGINVQIAAAGVFRHQLNTLPEVVFYRDGKTASIAVTETRGETNGYLIRNIRTNGKSDASIYVEGTPEEAVTLDDPTMIISGLLPMLYRPEISRAMNIGFGSGMTSRVLLLSPHLLQLDNVEIEPAMIEGAQHLGERVSPVFDDPRNHFIINDAKSVLARSDIRYDAITSEPSNPWVSGIANLFTKEFYQRIRAALKKDGVFVQWMPLYEIEPRLFASVVRALSEVFEDFHAYSPTGGDVIFIASAGKKLPLITDAVFASENMRAFLNSYGYRSSDDIGALFIGDKKTLLPYFESFSAPVNSDYFPYLENNAGRAFFNKTYYTLADAMFGMPVPVLEFLGHSSKPMLDESSSRYFSHAKNAVRAHGIYLSRLEEGGELQNLLTEFAAATCPIAAEDAANAEAVEQDDSAGSDYLVKISDLINKLMPSLNKSQMAEIWQVLEQDDCIKRMLENDDNTAGIYTQFWRAVSLRDGAVMAQTASTLLPVANPYTQSGQVLLLGAMAGHYQMGDYQRVVLLMLDMPLVYPAAHHAARMLSANAAEKI